MQRAQLIIAFLLGVVVALASALIVTSGRGGLSEAYAQQSANADMVAVMGTGDQGKSRDNLFVIDTHEKKLAVYSFAINQGGLNLVSVRNINWDMKLDEWPGNAKPSVKDIHDLVNRK